MKVNIGQKPYLMSRKEYEGLLRVAGEQIPFGVYALEKGDQAELRCDHCKSMTQLKRLTRSYRAQGFKVYANGR